MTASATVDASAASSLNRVLFDPATVALVGVSNDPARVTGRALAYLRRAGYQGTVFPVNRSRGVVQGVPAWPSLAALPSVPEQVFIMLPTAHVIAAVRECVELGVPIATVLADGFGETGPAGVALTRELMNAVAGSGTRILGPSSLGVVNLRNGLTLTANAAFSEADPLVGSTLAISQSGSMIGALMSRGKGLGVGFTSLVSVGNEVDLSVGEIGAATLDDPNIDGYALFLESIRGAASLRRFAEAALRKRRPVVAYKLGRSHAGAELAQSHTGALSGEEEVSAAFLADCGIARVRTLDGLLEGISLARRLPVLDATARSPKVGVLTTTGGGAAMVVDQLGVLGIDVQPPSGATFDRLAERGAPARPGRIVDLTLAGARYEVMRPALETLIEAGEHDVLVVVVGSSARYEPQAAVRPILEMAGRSRIPIAAFLVPDAPQGLAALTAAEVPCFRSPEACADAIVAVLSRRHRQALSLPRPADGNALPAALRAALARGDGALDEHGAYGLLDWLGVSRAPVHVLSDGDTAGLPFGFPVAAKALSSVIPHKSDVGGVLLGINGPEALAAAVATIRTSVARSRPDVGDVPVLVQPMIDGVAEVLVGYRIDRDAGPIVVVAAGGELAEVHADRSVRMAPVDLATAFDMIGEVQALQVLSGFRGRPPGDIAALAAAIVSMSRLAGLHEVTEAEINPLMVLPEGHGVVAVDALVRVAGVRHE